MVAKQVGEARTRWPRAAAASAPTRATARGSAARTGAARASRSGWRTTPLMRIILRVAFAERWRLIVIKAILLIFRPLVLLVFPILIVVLTRMIWSIEVPEDVIG